MPRRWHLNNMPNSLYPIIYGQYQLRNMNPVPDVPVKSTYRTLYVSNLPKKITQNGLQMFLYQHGNITDIKIIYKSYESPQASNQLYSFAFVTFSTVAEARSCYLSKRPIIDGRKLYIAPADDWHQPKDFDGTQMETSTSNCVPILDGDGNNMEECEKEVEELNILNVLNHDCFMNIFSYVPLIDLIRTERTSTRWRQLVLDKLNRIKNFNSFDWDDNPTPLTTNIFRSLMLKFGCSLHKIDITHNQDLNQRIPQLIGKFCPNLEEAALFGFEFYKCLKMFNWCSNLRSVSLDCCTVSDVHLEHLNPNIEEISLTYCQVVTGSFLSSRVPSKRLTIIDCCEFEMNYLVKAFDKPHPTIKCFSCNTKGLEYVIEKILTNMPNLELLSWGCRRNSKNGCDSFNIPVMPNLTELRLLNNCLISDETLENLSKNSLKLHTVELSIKQYIWEQRGNYSVSNKGVKHLLTLPCLKCLILEGVHISEGAFQQIGKKDTTCKLQYVNCSKTNISDKDILRIIEFSPELETIRAVSCPTVTSDLVQNAITNLSLATVPRTSPISLYIGNRQLKGKKDELQQMTCKYLSVFVMEDSQREIVYDSSDEEDFRREFMEDYYGDDDDEVSIYGFSDDNDADEDVADLEHFEMQVRRLMMRAQPMFFM